jgi:hypothetical protein
LTAVITVNTTNDTHTANVESGPQDGNGQISLRSAIQYADNNAGPFIIDVPNTLGTYTLTLGQLVLGNATYPVDSNFTIQGVTSTGAAANPATVVIRQTTTDRVFMALQPDMLHLAFSNLTIEGGNTGSTDTSGGSAILAGDGDLSTTTITNCIIGTAAVGNQSQAGPGAVVFESGGSLTISNTTFTNNKTLGGVGSAGGAVDFTDVNNDNQGNGATGNLSINNCTFTNNSAADVGGGAVEADQVAGGGTMAITNSAFIGNSVVTSVVNGGAIEVATGALTTNLSEPVPGGALGEFPPPPAAPAAHPLKP